MSSASRLITLVVLWPAYLMGSSLDVGGKLGPRIDRFASDFRIRHQQYVYPTGIGGYKFHSATTTWEKARKICKNEGADLVIINSEEEADYIVDLVARSLSGNQSQALENIWIGTFIPSEDQGEWQTIFGDSLDEVGYDDWQEEPDDDMYGRCGSVSIDGYLTSSECENDLGFVCELPYVKPISYKIHTSPVSWGDARAICRKEGGDLAIINSDAEAIAISGLITELKYSRSAKSYNPFNIWIGVLSPSHGQGGWQTIYGDSLKEAGYDTWQEEYDGEAHGNCGCVVSNGKITWSECWRALGFVCEGPYKNTDSMDEQDAETGHAVYQGPVAQ